MRPDYSFEPNPGRAATLDGRMHAGLADSLAHMLDRIGDALDFDRAGVQRLVTEIRRGARVAPLAFSDYYDAAIALFEEDHARAIEHLQSLAMHRPVASGQRFDPLRPYDSRDHAVYFRKMTADAPNTGLLPPDDAQSIAFFSRLHQGLTLGRSVMPELIGEFENLIRGVVCIAPDPAKKMQIDGGSHYQLWGALFLNSDYHLSDVAIVEVIAHEAAHSLLFGFCTDEPLILNDDDELFPSPLRVDPRPMDGIYHATFVSARMHWAMSRLLERGGLSPQQRELAEEAARTDRRNFEDGLAVVDAHAQLTDLGAALMNGARDWMVRSAQPAVAA